MSLRAGAAIMYLGPEPPEIRLCSSVVLIDTNCENGVRLRLFLGDVKQRWSADSVQDFSTNWRVSNRLKGNLLHINKTPISFTGNYPNIGPN